METCNFNGSSENKSLSGLKVENFDESLWLHRILDHKIARI
jgi:hypothetical protein